MTIDDVRLWATVRGGGGAGHVVVKQYGDWKVLACGLNVATANVTENRPKRICRRCREAVPYLKPVENGDAKHE